MDQETKQKILSQLDDVLALYPPEFASLMRERKLLMYELRQLPGKVGTKFCVFHAEHYEKTVTFSAGIVKNVNLPKELYYEWFDSLQN